MKPSQFSRKGFTLLEIIIMIIIIGVLTGLAIPRLFAMVEYTKSAEALSAMATIRAAVERCFLMHGSYTACARLPNQLVGGTVLLDIDNPSNSPGASFRYGLSGPFVGPIAPGDPNRHDYNYIISARYGCEGGGFFLPVCRGAISMTVYSDTIVKSGTGIFEKIK